MSLSAHELTQACSTFLMMCWASSGPQNGVSFTEILKLGHLYNIDTLKYYLP